MANIILNRLANVTVRETGLSNVTAATKLVYDAHVPAPASGYSPLTSQFIDTASPHVEVEMRMARLDDEIHEQSLPAPDFIKIDAEGMELHVLQGAAGTLKRWHPVLYIKLRGVGDVHHHQNVSSAIALLSALGYEITDIETGKKVHPGDVDWPRGLHCTAAQHP